MLGRCVLFFVNYRDHKIPGIFLRVSKLVGVLNKVDMSQYVKDLLNILVLMFVPDQYVTQEMCNEAVQRAPWALKYVSDKFITQEMCNEAVGERP